MRIPTAKDNIAGQLLVLPSCASGFRFAQGLAAVGPLRIIAQDAMLGRLAPNLAPFVRSPLTLWQECKTLDTLPFGVVSFADQIVGQGPSFRDVDIGGELQRFSTIEMMLVMRFALPMWLFEWRSSEPHLALRYYELSLPRATTQAAFHEAMRQWLSVYVDALCKIEERWFAEHLQVLRTKNGRDRALAVTLSEIEGLLRVRYGLLPFEGLTLVLQKIKVARRDLLSAAGPMLSEESHAGP